MVYKKYAKKGGKTYGPYLYENERIGGKVVTRYIGKPSSKHRHYLNFYLAGLVFFLILSVFLFFFWPNSTPHSKVTAEVEPAYDYGELITGKMKFNIREGELIPQESKIILASGEQSKELFLSDVSVKAELLSGSFYAENTSLSGYGDGYGVLGKKISYPTVKFQLLVTSSTSADEKEKVKEDKNDSKEEVQVTGGESDIEKEKEQKKEVSPSSESNSAQSSESEETDTDQGVGQNKAEKDKKEQSSASTDEGADASVESSLGAGEAAESPSSASEDSSSNSDSSSIIASSSESSSAESSSDSAGSSLTGGIIIETAYTVEGNVKKGEDFSYNLEEGQTAEIVEGSVMADGVIVDDGTIELDIEEGKAIVSTEYEIVEEGFGADFLGDYKLKLTLDLAIFALNATGERISLRLDYQGIPLASDEKIIVLEGVNASELNETNVTLLAPENVSSNLSLVQDIPSIRIAQNSSASVPLNAYFAGAERYEFSEVANITGILEGGVLTLTSDAGFKGARQGTVIAYAENASVQSNAFTILVSSGAVSIATAHDKIVVGKKVKWMKNVSLEVPEQTIIELPSSAENISVKKIEDGEALETEVVLEQGGEESGSAALTGEVTVELELKKKFNFFSFLRNLFKGITGKAVEEGNVSATLSSPIDTTPSDAPVEVVLQDNATEYLVEYYTDAPIALESNISIGKEVIISAPDELNYTDVLSFTSIPEFFSVGQEGSIQIYWKENSSYVPFDAYDTDGNEQLDYLEWITPHLSNQTFIIILITKAEHLDANRTFVEDIYEFVKERDGNWTLGIPDGHYVRVVFEQNLTSDKDITIYARVACASNSTVSINGINVPCDIYRKKLRLDELREVGT